MGGATDGGRSAKEILAAARRPEAPYQLCTRGDLQVQWEDLDRQLREAAEAGPSSIEGDSRVDISRQMEQLRTEMADSVLHLTLRALHKDAFRDMKAAHPPRKIPAEAKELGEDATEEQLENAQYQGLLDRQVGFNTETMWGPLLRASIVAPDLDDEDLDQLFEIMTDRQYEDLCSLAHNLNRGEVSVPFSQTASRLTRASAQS